MEKEPQILLVDDEQFILDIYKTKLEQECFKVLTASNGREALNLIKDNNFDIILLDIIMSKQDGFTTLKQLKMNINFKRIPVLMLTNLHNEQDKTEAMRLGAAGYFVKSEITPTELVNIVKKIVKE